MRRRRDEDREGDGTRGKTAGSKGISMKIPATVYLMMKVSTSLWTSLELPEALKPDLRWTGNCESATAVVASRRFHGIGPEFPNRGKVTADFSVISRSRPLDLYCANAQRIIRVHVHARPRRVATSPLILNIREKITSSKIKYEHVGRARRARFFAFFFSFFSFFAAASRFAFAVAAKFHVVRTLATDSPNICTYVRTHAFGQSSKFATGAVTLLQFANFRCYGFVLRDFQTKLVLSLKLERRSVLFGSLHARRFLAKMVEMIYS